MDQSAHRRDVHVRQLTGAAVDFKTLTAPVRFGRQPEDRPGVPKPLTRPADLTRKLAALREAGDVLTALPAQGESLHAIMTGRYDLTDLLAVLLDRLGTAHHLRIATLSFNRHNVRQLAGWVEAKIVGRLTVLCSSFFYEHNPEVYGELQVALADAGQGHRLAHARNHCKVVCLDFEGGNRLALEGSANLRTNSNTEQFCLARDSVLHDWHGAWIDAEVARGQIDAN